MRLERLLAHEGGHVVLLRPDARQPVEPPFADQAFRAQREDVAGRPYAAVHAREHVPEQGEHGGIGGGHPGEDAHAEAVEDRHHPLAGAGGFRLSLRRQGIEAGQADGVPGGVVPAHRGGGAGDARALERAGIVARKGLPLHRGDAPDPVEPAEARGALSHLDAEGRSRRHLAHEVQRPPAVPEGQQSRLDGHAHGGSGLHRVQPGVVAQPVDGRDDVDVPDAEVGAVQGDGFVFHAGGEVRAVRPVVDAGAGDGAARLTGVGHGPAAFPLQRGDAPGGQPLRVLEAAFAVVAGGHGPHFVDHVHEDRRAEFREHLAGQRVGAQGLDVGPARLAETPRVREGGLVRAFEQNDRLEAARAHDRAEPAARGGPGRVALAVRDLHRGIEVPPFPGGADADDGRLAAVAGAQPFAGGVGAESREFGGVFERRAVRADHEGPEALGASGHDHAAQPEPRQREPGGASGVGLLDRARERALAAHGEPPRARGRRARQQAVAQDQPVFRSFRVGGGVHFVQQQARDQPSPPERAQARSERDEREFSRIHIRPEQFHGGTSVSEHQRGRAGFRP